MKNKMKDISKKWDELNEGVKFKAGDTVKISSSHSSYPGAVGKVEKISGGTALLKLDNKKKNSVNVPMNKLESVK